MESNFFELIAARESCRKFDAVRPVEHEKLEQCFAAAHIAPSACNSQPWRFVAVTQADMVGRLRELVHQNLVQSAPALVILTEEKATLNARVSGQVDSQYFAQMDIGIVAAHFCLAATAVGLSTCMMGWWFDEQELKSLLGITEGRIRLVIAVGYAESDQLRIKQRKPLDEVRAYIK